MCLLSAAGCDTVALLMAKLSHLNYWPPVCLQAPHIRKGTLPGIRPGCPQSHRSTLSGAVTDATPYAAATQLSVDEVGHEIQLEALASVCIIQRVIAAVGIILCMFGSKHSNLATLVHPQYWCTCLSGREVCHRKTVL